jgi:adhesin transport system membrane fusion protein
MATAVGHKVRETARPVRSSLDLTLPAMRLARSPRTVRVLGWMLALFLIAVVVALIWTPWQQSVTGTGRVVAFAPIERQQAIDAPVDGRVVRWYVVEGQRVKKGDPIVEISDNDPDIMMRLRNEKEALESTIRESMRRLQSLEDRIKGLEDTRTTSVAAAKMRVQMAIDRIAAAEQALSAEEAKLEAAKLNIERQKRLGLKGLTSTRNVEVAEAEARRAEADVLRARAQLNAARAEKISLDSELLRIDADAKARLDEGWAAHASAASDVAKAQAELTKLEVRIARQATQAIAAPIDGTIFRVNARLGGEFIKAGEQLATLVPDSSNDVVELLVSGNDVPLISEGRKARLQFEGWPAIQFVGWPAVAVGTFGGEVILVDPTDNGQGQFRVLIQPDKDDEPWPSKRILRQGVRANGWILLNQVPLWFELWRTFNGFPPVVAMADPTAGEKGKGK